MRGEGRMYEDCSPAVQRAILAAAAWAGRLGRRAELPGPAPAPLSEVLTHGYELAGRHGEDATLTTDFFLLAILRTDDVLTRHLEGLGLRIAGLERAVIGKEYAPLALGEPLA